MVACACRGGTRAGRGAAVRTHPCDTLLAARGPRVYAPLARTPRATSGVVILANRNDTNLPIAVMDGVFNDYIGPPHVDWGGRLLAVMAKARAGETQSQAEHEISRQPHSEPSLPLGGLRRPVSDPLYGQVAVSLSDGHLMLTRGSESSGI